MTLTPWYWGGLGMASRVRGRTPAARKATPRAVSAKSLLRRFKLLLDSTARKPDLIDGEYRRAHEAERGDDHEPEDAADEPPTRGAVLVLIAGLDAGDGLRAGTESPVQVAAPLVFDRRLGRPSRDLGRAGEGVLGHPISSLAGTAVWWQLATVAFLFPVDGPERLCREDQSRMRSTVAVLGQIRRYPGVG